VESGLNDGICVPVIFIFLALANHTNLNTGTNALALRTVSEAIGIGLSVGCGLTFAVVKLIKLCDDRNWITASWRQLPIPALAVTCFSLAQLLGGSGFIASFAGGLLFGFLEKGRKHKLLLTAEGTGDTLALITWVIFGVLVVGRYIHSLTWQVVLYSLLSLTIIRMLPVFLVLSGVKLQLSEKLFIGWFGPRGLASIVFAVIIIKNQLPGHATIAMTASGTIVLSVILHGLTANPLVKALATRLERERQS
jgi:NhaP-type Na+/H+ or K+/H+ antiporter